MISFTDYMNKSLCFREVLTAYCVRMGNEAQDTRNHLKMLDCFDTEAKKNNVFRGDVFNWFNNRVSTIKLRELALCVGYDYWEDLRNTNIIDTFDTANIKTYK